MFYIQNYKFSKNIQNELLVINNFADKHPNSGSLNKLLQKFFDRIESWKCTHQNIEEIIGILMNIAYKNPKTYPIISSILAKFLNFLSSDKNKKQILERIIKKFKKIPNTEILNLHLQRISYNIDRDMEFEGVLCKSIHSRQEIWNNCWLVDSIKEIIEEAEIIDKKKLAEMPAIPSRKEVALFDKKTQYYN